ncbi:19074_t:CDS:1, partial [Gigaspora margarita]
MHFRGKHGHEKKLARHRMKRRKTFTRMRKQSKSQACFKTAR